MVLGSLEVIAEAYTIAEKSGIGQELVHEYIKGGRGARITSLSTNEGSFNPHAYE
jgi:3-hydroxyisobutyrate dehydrogenase-like beta-hydroxyacid dehydrogenase